MPQGEAVESGVVGSSADLTAAVEAAEQVKPRSWPVIVAAVCGLLAGLYVFLVGLQLLGDSFKCLGGRGAGQLFAAVSNPIAGLMTGILATVMVQSSSTSTSITVGIVGAGQIDVNSAIPIIMGANIGTSVTNTIVSMGQAGVRLDLQRAFAGATVHDMFNYLSVLCLLPIELIVRAVQGQGGPLFWVSEALTDVVMDGSQADDLFQSPIKTITNPVAKLVISNNKYVISALSFGSPKALTPNATNSSACSQGAAGGTAGAADCSSFYCVGAGLAKAFKKIDKSAYKEELIRCEGHILEPSPPCAKGEKCYLNAGEYFQDHVWFRNIIKGGFVQGAGDVGGGVAALVLSMVLLTGGLVALVKCLQILMLSQARRAAIYATKLNDYVAMLVGVGLTILVQSSSVVTSALTPFCGVGVLTLEKMLPLTLGANVGTTVTALIAAFVSFTHNAIQIAFCHLFFNIFGILIWFPLPFMRQVPLNAARVLGLYASFYRFVPLLYILLAFVAVPLVFLGVSQLYYLSVPGGVVLTLVVLGLFAAFEIWWSCMGGCYRVLSKEQRAEGEQRLLKSGGAPSSAAAAGGARGPEAEDSALAAGGPALA